MTHDENNRSLIPVPSTALTTAKAATGRVLSEMVGEMLALARTNAFASTGEYVNSLGMKFVPVAGTQVLFSVWETRVQDYVVFADETGREWPRPDFQQGPTHPAVNVNWEDAAAFCAWLSKNEERKYRLPTDAEWSVAVGLGVEGGSTPAEKNFHAVGYPWGDAWPPPRGTGNYGRDLKVDDFDYTSPLGSFVANHFGLYDLGGNVYEWCEDRFHDGKKESLVAKEAPVLRGGSWYTTFELELRSSFRSFFGPTGRFPTLGFRCVLVVSES